MLGFFGKKSDHPLADLKTAQQVLDAVPQNDALGAVQGITDWLESLSELGDEFRLDHQFAVLRMFDEAAQPHVRKLIHDYFSVQPLSKFQENRLWSALNNFYVQSEALHLNLLRRYRNGDRGVPAMRSLMPLVAARGIAALSGRLKFLAARYALVGPELWGHLAEFYAQAESSSSQDEALTLYTGLPSNDTVARQFSALLVWYGLSAGTLSPLSEHITERLLAFLSKSFRVSTRFDEGCLFAFDLNQPTPSMRASGEMTIHPGFRMVIEGDVLVQLGGILKTLDKDIVPEDINFYGAAYDPELVKDVAKYLEAGFSMPPPKRRNPRRKINVNLHIATGFFKMLEQTDIGLNFSQGDTETWDVEDISVTGFRSVIPANRADGVKIGSLIGSRPENVAQWGAGIVRRLSRDEKNNLHVGVEMLSNQIVGVALTLHKLGSHDEQSAMYVHRANDTSGEAWLLMKPDTYSASRSLNMHLSGKYYLLLPLGLAEHGEDFDLVRYRKMEQDGSGEE